VINHNKGNSIAIWNTLKEIIKSKASSNKETEDINFESLDNTGNSNVANKFNLFYIQSIDNIITSINDTPENSKEDTNTYQNENRESLQHFDTVTIEEIEGIIRQLL